MNAFGRFASLLGVAFQIQDDVLNLVGTGQYGKEIAGDLWEGKHTLILIHAMRRARESERAEALRILENPGRRPKSRAATSGERVRRPPAASPCAGNVDQINQYDRRRRRWMNVANRCKTQGDVEFLRELVERYDGIGGPTPAS